MVQGYENGGGGRLADLIRDKARQLPVFVMAENPRCTPGITARIGVALGNDVIVATVDGSGYSTLSGQLGKECTCFKGGGCVYLPGWGPDEFRLGRFRFPWPEMWACGGDECKAADHIVGLVRSAVMPGEESRPATGGAANGSLGVHHAGNAHSRSGTIEAIGDLAAKMGSMLTALSGRLEGLANEREEDRRQHNRDWRRHKKAMEELRKENRNLRAMLDAAVGGRGRPRNEWGTSPVSEMVKMAAEDFAPLLAFGEQAFSEAAKVDAADCPPRKVYFCLSALHEHASTMRHGTHKVDVVRWLSQEGCKVSGESKSTTERYGKRILRFEGNPVEFYLHMKPSPNVRIYFKWDPASGRYLIGWVGRHLPTTRFH